MKMILLNRTAKIMLKLAFKVVNYVKLLSSFHKVIE